jgi:hypothetical protein
MFNIKEQIEAEKVRMITRLLQYEKQRQEDHAVMHIATRYGRITQGTFDEVRKIAKGDQRIITPGTRECDLDSAAAWMNFTDYLHHRFGEKRSNIFHRLFSDFELQDQIGPEYYGIVLPRVKPLTGRYVLGRIWKDAVEKTRKK